VKVHENNSETSHLVLPSYPATDPPDAYLTEQDLAALADKRVRSTNSGPPRC
jgi:hypothetical protein